MSRATRPIQLRDAQGTILATTAGDLSMTSSRGGTVNITHLAYSRPGTALTAAGWKIMKHTYDATNTVVRTRYVIDSKDYADFDQIWDDSSAVAISAITKAADGQVTTSTAHGYNTGDKIEIVSVSGMTEVDGDGYGSIVFTITKVDATKFTLGVDTSGYTTYTSGGNCFARDYLNYTYA